MSRLWVFRTASINHILSVQLWLAAVPAQQCAGVESIKDRSTSGQGMGPYRDDTDNDVRVYPEKPIHESWMPTREASDPLSRACSGRNLLYAMEALIGVDGGSSETHPRKDKDLGDNDPAHQTANRLYVDLPESRRPSPVE